MMNNNNNDTLLKTERCSNLQGLQKNSQLDQSDMKIVEIIDRLGHVVIIIVFPDTALVQKPLPCDLQSLQHYRHTPLLQSWT